MSNEPDVAATPVRNLGKVQKFIVGADFEAYAEQLDFFFVANGVTDSKQKKAVLLTNLPTETYQLAKDLMAPILLREDSLTYDTRLRAVPLRSVTSKFGRTGDSELTERGTGERREEEGLPSLLNQTCSGNSAHHQRRQLVKNKLICHLISNNSASAR